MKANLFLSWAGGFRYHNSVPQNYTEVQEVQSVCTTIEDVDEERRSVAEAVALSAICPPSPVDDDGPCSSSTPLLPSSLLSKGEIFGFFLIRIFVIVVHSL